MDVDFLIGEVSNGPFDTSISSQKHAQEDKEKVFKALKDSFDNIINLCRHSQNFKQEIFENIYLFGISAHGG